jgi:transcriptional regulator with XRE-family HTH domain
MREALDAWHMGRVFYAYRTHPWHGRPLSQETLAGWLGLTQAQLSRIENARTPPQDLGKLMSWAHGLRIPGDLLWFKLPSARSAEAAEEPGSTLSTTERDAMSPLDRRSLLKGGVLASLPGLSAVDLQHVAAALNDARRYLDGPVVEYFRRHLDAAKHDDGARGPRKTLPMVLGLLGAIEQHARDVRPDVRRELLSVGADGAEFAGWLYRDLHEPVTAGFWYDRAMEWAQEADDPAMQGYVLLKKSQMAYDDRDALRVLTLAEAAQHSRWQLPLRVQAEATQQVALGAAMVGGSLSVVQERLGSAAELMARVPDREEGAPALGAYFTEHTLLLRNAVSYTEAGKPGLAVELFDKAMRPGQLSLRDAGFFNARRASALALSGEADEAARVGTASAEVAVAMASSRTVRVLNEALLSLGRWSSRPAVREFRETLRVSRRSASRPPFG